MGKEICALSEIQRRQMVNVFEGSDALPSRGDQVAAMFSRAISFWVQSY